LVGFALCAGDFVAIFGAAILSGVCYHLVIYEEPGRLANYADLGLSAAAIFVTLNLLRVEYSERRIISSPPRLRTPLQLWLLTAALLLVVGFLSKTVELYSRGSSVVFFLAAPPLLIALRYTIVCAIRRAVSAGAMHTTRIFIFGTGSNVLNLIDQFNPKQHGMKIVGCQFLTPHEGLDGPADQRQVFHQDVRKLVANARRLGPDVVILLLPWSNAEAIAYCVDELLSLPVELRIGPDGILSVFPNAQIEQLGPLKSLLVARAPLTTFGLLLKRAIDLVGATFLLCALSPLLLVVALLIKLDSRGPVFFMQRRFGFNQKPFKILKFRTMYSLDDSATIVQATRDDPRITRVGKSLRRWNLDELPQLFNVIFAEMSLVGPRPHALAHNLHYENQIRLYARRHNVKPGITGWAQVHGLRGETDSDEKMAQRVAYDLYYIENWSLALDINILLRTLFGRSVHNNAY
jgi:Undecaprenyl-phosphate glucose phosphotransferase